MGLSQLSGFRRTLVPLFSNVPNIERSRSDVAEGRRISSPKSHSVTKGYGRDTGGSKGVQWIAGIVGVL